MKPTPEQVERGRAIAAEVEGARWKERHLVIAQALADESEREQEACAAMLAARAAKIAEDAKTIALGARSARRTFLEACPAWDVEQFVAGVVNEDAAAIRGRGSERKGRR